MLHLLRRINQQWQNKLGSRDATTAPLLSQDAILDLLYRVQHRSQTITPVHEVAHRLLGDARSVYRGTGMDYDESRPYQPGDEVRFMNWRVTARTGEPYMKVFREERRPGVFLLIDRRLSMRFGTRVRLKVTQAARTAAILAFAARQRNAPVSGVVWAHQSQWLEETHDDQGAFHLINTASRPCPPDEPTPTEPSLEHLLRLLHTMLTPGTTVYLISDFADLTENCRPALMQLSLEHDVKAIHIADPAELRLPAAGCLRLRSPQQDAAVSIDTSDPAVATAYESAVATYFATREQLLRSTGVPYLRLSSDIDEIEDDVLRL